MAGAARHPSGTPRLLFAPGDTRKTIAILVLDDDEEETYERFMVRLSNARHATLADGEGIATITDDDAGRQPPPRNPALTINDVTVAEDAGTAVFTVRLNPHSAVAVSVAYATANGTANAGSDYTATSGTSTTTRRRATRPSR